MLDMMESIIEESDVVADELFDVIFENLVPKVKTERPAAYQLARSLVERTANSLQGCVHPFFIHLLGEAGEDSPLAPHVYDLIAEVDTIDHNILLRVMPHLEFQLRMSACHQATCATGPRRMVSFDLVCIGLPGCCACPALCKPGPQPAGV